MRSLRYLNTILTILAVLLGLEIWTTWMRPGDSGLASPAVAGADTRSTDRSTGGIPDAGAQRKEMIDLLKQLNVQQADVVKVLKSGEVRVKLEDAPNENK